MEEQHKQKWTHTWWGMLLLLLLAVTILFIGYFGSLTAKYYQQLEDGTIDLSEFSSNAAITKLEDAENIETVSNSYVDNFADDPSIGPENAKLTIVAFEDFECPYCREVFPNFKTVINKYSDRVRFVYRDYPVESAHPHAQAAAEAAQCAHAQGKFWEYHDTLFSHQDQLEREDLIYHAQQVGIAVSPFTECIDSREYQAEVEADFTDGTYAGVLGTPTFFFNGNKVEGVITLEGFETIIQYFLTQ